MRNMIDRSNNFVAVHQIDGLCSALRFLMANGGKPGKEAWPLLRSLRDGFLKGGGGHTVEHVPEVSDRTTTEDLLLIAEVLKATMIAFLTPEERQESRVVLGFRSGPADA